MVEIIVSVITSAATLICTIIAVVIQNRKSVADINQKQEIFNTKITAQLEAQTQMTTMKLDGLASEVREHNNFARRMPVVEEQIKVINHRIEDLERDKHERPHS